MSTILSQHHFTLLYFLNKFIQSQRKRKNYQESFISLKSISLKLHLLSSPLLLAKSTITILQRGTNHYEMNEIMMKTEEGEEQRKAI